MSLSMKPSRLDGGINPVNLYIMANIDKYLSRGGSSSYETILNKSETVSESPFMRKETYYEDSTIRDKSSGSSAVLENLDTIDEEEEFEIDEINEKALQYPPRTLLEAVDTMILILEDLGNRYNRWKYNNNGLYRFYCHKYNLTNIESSRPYYSKILNQLTNMDSISLHLLSTHYRKKSDAAVYSSNDLVDNVLCQLDELVSCYCSKKCALGMPNKVTHVCSDINKNHTNLKWKYPTTAERFLTLNRSTVSDRTNLTDKAKSMDRNPSLEWSRPSSRTLSLDQNIFHRTISSETIKDLETQYESAKYEDALDKLHAVTKSSTERLNESCFIREMGGYGNCVMHFFSERGIMHNFSQPYRKGDEAVPIQPFLRAVVCFNCGKFCRCRCQRKIFRKYTGIAESPEHSQSSHSSDGDCFSHAYGRLESFEKMSMDFINKLYKECRRNTTFRESSHKIFRNKEHMALCESDLHLIHSHTLKTPFGRVQFLTNSTESTQCTNRNFDRYAMEERQEEDEVFIYSNVNMGSRLDNGMGSVYFSNLFKGTMSRVSSKEIFEIINTVPFSCVPVEFFNAYKKADWHEMYTSVWWRLDSKFEDAHVFDDEGNLESYILNVLDALGYLGNLRYDSSFKVIGVGYYRKKICYWRFFYVRDMWESFRCAVEYFILISTLHPDVHIDYKLSCFVALKNGIQKKFSFHPSVLSAYNSVVTYICGPDINKTARGRSYSLDRRSHIKNPCGVEYFDINRVGNRKCTVADVVEVSLKRKMVSLPDSSAPKRHYTQKATSATPTIKLKLDPQLIYQGIFVSTPNTAYNNDYTNGSNLNLQSGVKPNGYAHQGNYTPNNAYLSSFRSMISVTSPSNGNRNGSNVFMSSGDINTNNSNPLSYGNINNGSNLNGDHINNNLSVNGFNGMGKNRFKDGNSVENLFDLKLNNLNIILSYYPDVCAQYSTIIKQAKDLSRQLTLLLSDLKCIVFDPVQKNMDTIMNGFNIQNGEFSITAPNCNNGSISGNSNISNGIDVNNVNNGSEFIKQSGDVSKSTLESKEMLSDIKKRQSVSNKKDISKLPMFDVCYNKSNNSWTCFLEVMPCLVCTIDCDRTGTCVYYTQGRRLIEMLCSKIKPSEVRFTLHPHFDPEVHQNHQDKRTEVSVISFSVNQFGNERARLLATQLKATYKIQALNTILMKLIKEDKTVNLGEMKKNNEVKINENNEINEEDLNKTLEMKLLHNAITSQLTTMMSTNSYIIYDNDEEFTLSSKKSNFMNSVDADKGLKVNISRNNLSYETNKKGVARVSKVKGLDMLDDLIKDKVKELNMCKMDENTNVNAIHSNNIEGILVNGNINNTAINDSVKGGYFKMLDQMDTISTNYRELGEIEGTNSINYLNELNENYLDTQFDTRMDFQTNGNESFDKDQNRYNHSPVLKDLLVEQLDQQDAIVKNDFDDDCGNMEDREIIEDVYRDCVCYHHGNRLRGSEGEFKVSSVLKINEKLSTFSNIFEMNRLIQLNSKKIQYCSRHCCFVTVWRDVIDQKRIMFHPIEKFINFKAFNEYVNKFKNDWPEAVRLHNLHSRSRDASEGSKMFAKVNVILCDCFNNLLNLQRIINDAIVASMSLAIRVLSDASQEKGLLSRLFLINEHLRLSKDTMRSSFIYSNEILFPFGALHDEATPPISDDDF